ncbi:MAG TPA: protein kinase, partial [Thermoanaerobaculia bacterium]|nr:protein kinase [Thermoanaerobaculia bacterium]
MTLEPGTVLLHYRLTRRLGSGGFGEVYEAQDTRLGRLVALKVLRSESAGDPEGVERFRREARALASLDHPGIVTVHAIEELDGRLFLVMERVDGATLSELIHEGRLELPRLFELALPLTDAIAAAHQQGVIHRDLKPGNIMVTPDGRPKVLDFGLARLIGPVDPALPTATVHHLTHTGAAMGTWHYMASEQMRGEPADARSDVFSLGVILYEMAAGERPFSGASVVEVIEAVCKGEPATLGLVRPDLPASFSDLVHWCLERKRGDRPSDARLVHDALAGLLRAGERSGTAPGALAAPERGPAPAAGAPPPSAAVRSARLPLLAGAAALVAVVLVLAAVALRFQPVPPPPAAVAVLPFVNMTGEADRDHLARGIPAGLITRLGQVSGLQVLSRSESWDVPVQGLTAVLLAKELGVASVVEGELHADADDLRVDVKLTDGPSGLVLWSEGFHGREEALFDLQRTIAGSLVRVLAVPLSAEERRRMARDPTGSLAAYAHHLRGEQLLAQVADFPSAERAAAQFREALRRDPALAPAEAGLAEALLRRFEERPNAALLEEADRHARRALALDPALGPARVALARVARARGRPGSAIEELQEVIPSLSQPDGAYRELAAAYEQMGDLEQAERSLRLAVSSGEESWLNWNRLGALLLRGGRYDEARQALQRAAELAPAGIYWPELNLATLELLQANWQAAVAAFEATRAPAHDPRLATNLGTAYFFLGRLEEAEALYRRAVRLAPSDPTFRRNLGDVLLRQGKGEAAREAFRAALERVRERLARTPGDTQL